LLLTCGLTAETLEGNALGLSRLCCAKQINPATDRLAIDAKLQSECRLRLAGIDTTAQLSYVAFREFWCRRHLWSLPGWDIW